MKTYRIFLIILLTLIIQHKQSLAESDFHVTQLDNPAPGYLIFDWLSANSFFAVDNYGYSILEQIPSDGFKTSYFKPLSNGLWAVFSDNKFYLYDKNLKLVDSLSVPPQFTLDFHDIITLKNGNYLLLCTEQIVKDMSKVVEGGFTDALVIFNVLIETDINGTIFWQWNSSEHLAVSDVTQGVNLKNKVIDLVHINSMQETDDGNILVSIRHYDEVSLIDKSTGNFIWRLGGSRSKKNQFHLINDNFEGFFGFSHQHTAQILPNGNLLLYDNGNLKIPLYSRAVEYEIDVVNMTATKVWDYRYNPDIFAAAMGSVQRLDNGNTLINWGNGKITEVKPDKSIAFEITNYGGFVYRAFKVTSIANTTSRYISAPTEYDFNSDGNNTNIKIHVTSISSTNEASIQKHNYPPHSGNFNDSSFTQIYPFRWVFSTSNVSNISGKFKISTATIPEILNPAKTTIYKRDKETVGVFYPLNTTYNASTGEIIGDFQGFGEFVLVSNILSTPILSTPINGAKVLLSSKMTWQHVVGVENYQIQIDTVSDFSKPFTDSLLTKQNSFNYVEFKENTKYYWRVRAINSKDISDWSDIFYFTTISSAPELLYPDDGAVGIALSESVVWDGQSEMDTYHLQISKSNDFKEFVVNLPTFSDTKFALKNLDFNTTYFWRVLINYKVGASDWSEVRSFTTTFETPILVSPSNNLLNALMPVEFKWSSPVDVDSYIIEISDTKNFDNRIYSRDNIIADELIVDDLDYGLKYFWRIRAKKDKIFSDWTKAFEFVTQLKTPSLISPSDNEGDVQLSSNLVWKLTELNYQYAIQVSKSADFTDLIIDTILFGSNSLPLKPLELNTAYYWRVKAVNNEKQSAWSKPWMFRTTNNPKLDAPRQIYPWNYFFANIEGIVSWNSVTFATKYRLQLAKDLDFVSVEIDVVLDNDTTKWYSNLDYEKTYFWRVKALNDKDSGDWSSTWRFTTMPKVYQVTLLSPSNDMLQVPISGNLQWYYVPAIENYSIQLSEFENFSQLHTDTEINNIWWHNYTDLKHNTRYYWRVRFKRDGEISDWSNVWTFRTVTEDSLARPRTVSPYEFEAVHPPQGVTFVWNQIPEADSYQISISANRSFDQLITKIDVNNDTTFNFSELDFKNFYYWRVSAINAKTQSAWSGIRSFYTLLEIPEIIYPVDNAAGIPYGGKLQWQHNDTMNFFRIQISKSTDFNEADIVLDLDSIRQFSHYYLLEANQSYFMRIRTYNFFNRSIWSDPISFTTGNTTNVYDILHNYGIAVFPNPASDFVQVLATGIKHYKVVDVLGNVVIQKVVDFSDEIRVDISEIPNGLYFIIVNQNEYRSMFIKRD
jgi:hypothetical protein